MTFGNGTISNSTSASATYNAPAVTSDESVQVRLTVTASGTGTNAADGTSDDGIDFESFTVEDVPAVITTDTDRIYTLGEVEPGRPTGGETQETTTCRRMVTNRPRAHRTAAVYTSARTRTFTNGVFTSALLWGPVTVHLPRLLALSDYATPSGYTDDFVALIEAEVSNVLLYRNDTGVGTLLEGDLDLDAADITISRVQRRDAGATLRFFRDGADSFATAVQTGGAYAAARITLQTIDGTISLDLPGALDGTEIDQRASFSVPAADQAVFNGIDTGERFILAIARALHSHSGSRCRRRRRCLGVRSTPTHRNPYAVRSRHHGSRRKCRDLGWAFQSPEPTVTHTQPSVRRGVVRASPFP